METDARSTPSSMTPSGSTSVANTSATEQMERLTKVESQISELTALVRLLVPKPAESNDAEASVPVTSGASSLVDSADPPRQNITATVPPKAATGPHVGDLDDRDRPTDSNEAARDRRNTSDSHNTELNVSSMSENISETPKKEQNPQALTGVAEVTTERSTDATPKPPADANNADATFVNARPAPKSNRGKIVPSGAHREPWQNLQNVGAANEDEPRPPALQK